MRGGRKHDHQRHTVERVCESAQNLTKQKAANPQRTTQRYEFIFTNQKHLSHLPVLLANANVNRNAFANTYKKHIAMRAAAQKHIVWRKNEHKQKTLTSIRKSINNKISINLQQNVVCASTGPNNTCTSPLAIRPRSRPQHKTQQDWRSWHVRSYCNLLTLCHACCYSCTTTQNRT